MSGTYKAYGGEEWSTVARRTTGNDTDAAAIRDANPGIPVPLLAGTVVQVPMAMETESPPSGEELEIRVNGQKLGTVNDIELAISIDAISKGGFVVPNTPETRKLFRYLSAPRVTIDYKGERIFTGRAESHRKNNGPDEKTLDIPIYADPAIMETCPAPISAFPLEWKQTGFEQIATALAAHFGITVKYDAPDEARFKRVDIQPGQNVYGFLTELATQRGLIMTSGSAGELVIHKGNIGNDVVSFIEKDRHPAQIEFNVDESKYYSSVTGIVPSKSKPKKLGKRFTIKNPIQNGIKRPGCFEAKDIDKGELEKAVQSVAGRMFAELVSCNVELATWDNDLGGLYQPGQLVKIKSPEDDIPEPFEFLVNMVTLRRSATSVTSSLNLSLPGVYSGEIPEKMPWG